MIGERELINTYLTPFYGMKNPNIYVEFASSNSSYLLLEDGFDILQEDGVYKLLLES
jgi:hypothetical protein